MSMSRPLLRTFVELLDFFEIEFFMFYLYLKKEKEKKGKKEFLQENASNLITKPSKSVPFSYLFIYLFI